MSEWSIQLTSPKVALKTLIDNFAVLGIEFCLMERLKDLFTPADIAMLGDDLTKTIAQESEDSKLERDRLTQKMKVLQDGLDTLTQFRRQHTSGS